MALVNSLQPVPVSAPYSAFEPLHIGPQISAKRLLAASANDKQALIDIHELLNRLFARNRNQHRRNHWFKSLHQFRKQLGLLINELEGFGGNTKGGVKGRLEQRLRYWDEKCIHQWYLHFTQLVAVGPFAVLGLVLMACTARVCRITGITDLYEEIASEDMKSVLQSVDGGAAADEFGEVLGGDQEEEDDDDEDMGIVIRREDY
ncbi:hypothetical protein P154DRAFT_44935 [Amniculicola lignicola CBS 123094]|uniref:RNase MRP protein 1 RNA binding domain-containing protein n=1 Tax=Amniculicola lignicola CBS 123094 TaxID=1392246 RepID=A0A6A5WRM1_9PLEO|nr:hypothetical protein P154DRAFT_44935 [Amniculicola lignicola CBS 123094]